jgi:hypothetical protein
MKRSSWIAVGVFAVLLTAWLAKGMKSPPTAPAPLSIDGYVGAVSDDEMRAQTKDKLSPVKQLTVKSQDSELILAQLPQDPPAAATPDKADAAKPPEAKWSAKLVRKGRSSEAKAMPYRANAMAEVFGRSIRSTFSREIKDSDKAEFGLDTAQAIDVEAQWAGRSVKMRIGKLDKGSEGTEPTTWVQDPARPSVVFQVAGRDLRSPFETRWSDLRDRNLLVLDLGAIDKVEVENPADPRAVRFSLSRPPLASGAKREAGEGWAITAPVGYPVGDVGEWLRSVERLSAADFVDPADAAERKLATGLDDPKIAAKLTIMAGSSKTVLVFGAVDASSESKDVWMRIEGRDELYKIASYSRDQVLTRFDQLRQRALLGGAKAKDATEVRVVGPAGELAMRRNAGVWQLTSGQAVATSAVDSYLGDLDGVQVDFAADATPGSAGLLTPEWTVRLTLANGETMAVELSKEVDGHVFGSVVGAAGRGDIFKLQAWNAGKLRKTSADFADKRLIPWAKDAISAVEVRPVEGEAFSAELGATGWNLKRGSKIETIEPDIMAGWLTALTSIERGAATEKSAADAGLDKQFDVLQIKGKDAKILQIAISRQKSGEEVWVSTLQNGKAAAISAIPQSSAALLQKTADSLAKNSPADPGAGAPPLGK